MASHETSRVADAIAWGGNVSTSVAIIFINKILMSSTGYGFRYGEQVPHSTSLRLDMSEL